MEPIIWTAPRDARLDVLVAEGCGVTRSQAARWIDEGLCSVNGVPAVKAGTAVRSGAALAACPPEPEPLAAEKQDIPLTFLYQDADIAVVDKPCGMVVHPAAGNLSGTLVNALLFALPDLSGVGGVIRPGIVHRLDKDTSGLMLVAKNDAAHLALSRQLKDRAMEKHYLAVVDGPMKQESGEIDRPIGRSERDRKKMAVTESGRPARTDWALLENLRGAALLDVRIHTGRTHQIRVHMQNEGHPVAGDPLYGLKNGVHVPRMMLHAHMLAFTHPRTGQRMALEASPPMEFMDALARLRLDSALPLRLHR